MKEFEITLEEKYRNSGIMVRNLFAPNMQARMATQLIERWGMVAGVPEGEDSAGRSTVRVMTPDEIVQRATDTAALALSKFEELGWLVPLPTQAEEDKMHLSASNDGIAGD